MRFTIIRTAHNNIPPFAHEGCCEWPAKDLIVKRYACSVHPQVVLEKLGKNSKCDIKPVKEKVYVRHSLQPVTKLKASFSLQPGSDFNENFTQNINAPFRNFVIKHKVRLVHLQR